MKKITLWRDFKIFVKTIFKVLGASDIVEGRDVLEDKPPVKPEEDKEA